MATFDQIYTYVAQHGLKDRPIIGDLHNDVQFMLTNSTTVTQLINEAEAQLAERTYCIIDEESLAITNAAFIYDLPDYVLSVKQAVLYASVEDTYSELIQLKRNFSLPAYPINSGRPQKYLVQFLGARKRIQFDYLPDKDYTVIMLSARLPKEPYIPLASLTTDEEKDLEKAKVSEIPNEYAYRILDYVIFRVLSGLDVDKSQNQERKAAEDRWEQTVTELKRRMYRESTDPSFTYTNPWY